VTGEPEEGDGDPVPATAAKSCPNCDEQVFAGDAYCEACGHSLDAKAGGPVGLPAMAPAAHALLPGADGTCPGCGGTAISDGYCDACGLLQAGDRDHVEAEVAAAAAVSNKGLRHIRNEDAMALTALCTGATAAVVCDGVSSAPRSDKASLLAAKTGAGALSEQVESGADPVAATRAAAVRAAQAVAGLAASEHDAPACTYVSAIVDAEMVTIAWVGDSRAYWLAGPGARPSAALTVDDSWAAQMVARGVLSDADAQADQRAHALTSWLGGDAGEVTPHVETFAPGGPGLVVLCSDGLWNYLPDPDALAAALPGAALHAPDGPAAPGASPLEAARSLVRIALEAGGRDNITVAVIPFPPPARPLHAPSLMEASSERSP
jgi:serine/threonine protein phosphatase PrpC